MQKTLYVISHARLFRVNNASYSERYPQAGTYGTYDSDHISVNYANIRSPVIRKNIKIALQNWNNVAGINFYSDDNSEAKLIIKEGTYSNLYKHTKVEDTNYRGNFANSWVSSADSFRLAQTYYRKDSVTGHFIQNTISLNIEQILHLSNRNQVLLLQHELGLALGLGLTQSKAVSCMKDVFDIQANNNISDSDRNTVMKIYFAGTKIKLHNNMRLFYTYQQLEGKLQIKMFRDSDYYLLHTSLKQAFGMEEWLFTIDGGIKSTKLDEIAEECVEDIIHKERLCEIKKRTVYRQKALMNFTKSGPVVESENKDFYLTKGNAEIVRNIPLSLQNKQAKVCIYNLRQKDVAIVRDALRAWRQAGFMFIETDNISKADILITTMTTEEDRHNKSAWAFTMYHVRGHTAIIKTRVSSFWRLQNSNKQINHDFHLSVIEHELGHAVGLGHCNKVNKNGKRLSVMNTWADDKHFVLLSPLDVKHINTLYTNDNKKLDVKYMW